MPEVVQVRVLLESGMRRPELERLVREGQYRRVGNGWLATDRADADVVAAVRRGTRLTCLSAARSLGLWTPPFTGTHVFVRRGLIVPPGCRDHRPEPRTWPDRLPLAPLTMVLEHTIRCAGTEVGAMVLESAWNGGMVGRAGVDDLLGRLPSRVQDSLARTRHDAQSGTETRVRRWFERRRVRVRTQVEVAGVGRVDLLVGSRWVLELDSKAHHAGVTAYAADRRRDLELRRQGYLVTRLTWEQVFLGWEATTTALGEILRQGEHHRQLFIPCSETAEEAGCTA